jgi:hypothetical protein
MDNVSEIVLRTSRTKLCLLITFSLVFVAIGVWELWTGEFWWGAATVLLFGVGGLSSVLALTSDRFYSLRINEVGFTYCNLFRCCHVDWDVVAKLAVSYMSGVKRTEFIVWSYSPGAQPSARRLFMDMSLLGFDAGCPAIGMPAKDLLALMEQYRSQHARSAAY